MALENVVEVHDGKVVGAFTSQAKNVAYNNTDSGLSATDVQGAVDEVNGKFGSMTEVAHVTGDGVKTYRELLNTLRASVPNLKLSHRIGIGARYFAYYGNQEFGALAASTSSGGRMEIRTILLDSTNSTYITSLLKTDNTVSITDNSNSVLPSGSKFYLYDTH